MRTHLVLALLLATVGGGPALAADEGRGEPMVSVRQTSAGTYLVTAQFDVPEAGQIAWDVLTDYANIPRFVPDIRASIVHERSNGQVRVEQEATSKFLMFSKRVHLLLEIQETDDVITFRDTGRRSFAHYAGSWRITRLPEHTHIAYELTAQPSFDVPTFLVTRVLTRDANQMIDRLRAEMARRAADER